MAPNLTRAEAGERAALITVMSYQVDLDLTRGDTTFGSQSVIRFRCAAPGAGTFVNLTAPAVTGITLNGEPVAPGAFDGERIALTGLAAENVLIVDAECAYSRSGEGMHRFTDPTDGNVYLYSDLETFKAHRIYACFDQPDMKASYELSATAPPGWQVVSNLAPRADEAVAGPAGDTIARRWRFPATPPLPTYITHISAGPYHVVRDKHDGISLGIYCRQSLAEYLNPEEIFTITKQGMDFYQSLFGIKYPFGKYDLLFVPEFNAGAMENAGAVTVLEGFIFRSRVTDQRREERDQTLLHEMAHMWFGDLVTMRWWDDLWLNESFATWASLLAQTEATRWISAWTVFAQGFKGWAYQQDQLPSTHPIATDMVDIQTVEVNFDGITYAKGAAVVKQLVAYVGQENFLAGVRKYFAAHAWGNATLADLLAALEQTSGRDLTAWSHEWLQTAGVNTLRADYTLDDSGRFASFAVLQEAAASHPVLRSHRIAIGLYTLTDGTLNRTTRIEADIAGPSTAIPGLIGLPRPDLILVNDDDLSYAKIRLDEHSLRTLMSSIGAFSHSLPGALCWAATWEMCRDGGMTARDYVQLVLTGVPSVADISMVQLLLKQAGQAARQFTDPARRAAGLEQMARSLRKLAESAPAGSDTQLAYLRAFAATATSAGDLSFIAALLNGAAALAGLTVDTDLRWTLLRRLVSRGMAGETEIAAELAADSTDTGERSAAACRAAIPSTEAKLAAWQSLTSGTLTLATFRAVLGGFADPDQPELTGPYRERYFAAISDASPDWPAAMTQDFVSSLYPSLELSAETVAATDAYITSAEPPASLRRLLSEGRADMLRALRCQERDRQAK
ncbi:MAG TPA: aminopeptidase N [Streptosporangiaceae bacterium]